MSLFPLEIHFIRFIGKLLVCLVLNWFHISEFRWGFTIARSRNEKPVITFQTLIKSVYRKCFHTSIIVYHFNLTNLSPNERRSTCELKSYLLIIIYQHRGLLKSLLFFLNRSNFFLLLLILLILPAGKCPLMNLSQLKATDNMSLNIFRLKA